MKGFFKEVTGPRFYVKPIRGGYWGVYNKLDRSLESLCLSQNEAEDLAKELNEIRNNK